MSAERSVVAFVGDMHMHPEGWADIIEALAAIEGLVAVVQVGDFGYRFNLGYLAFVQAVAARLGVRVYWIDGNHDNHEVIAAARREDWTHPVALWPETAPDVYHVPRGGVLTLGGYHRFVPGLGETLSECLVEVPLVRILCVGGAVSTDVYGRKDYLEWWPTEALTMAETYRAMDAAAGRIDIMVCHDVPAGAEPDVAGVVMRRYNVPTDVQHRAAAHRDALAEIAAIAQPRLIVHGHHHHRYNGRWKGARVIGLGRDGMGADSWVAIDLEA